MLVSFSEEGKRKKEEEVLAMKGAISGGSTRPQYRELQRLQQPP